MFTVLTVGALELDEELQSTFLQRAGWRLLSADSGATLLDQVRAERPDLLLIDTVGREDAGLAFCRQVKAERELARIPILVLGRAPTAATASEAGADAFVTKPVSRERLLAAIRKLLPTTERTSERRQESLRVAFFREGRESLGYTRDLSADGLFLRSSEPFVVGEALALVFDMPGGGGTTVHAEGRVVRVVPAEAGGANPGAGIQFERLSPRDHLELSRFVREGAVAAS